MAKKQVSKSKSLLLGYKHFSSGRKGLKGQTEIVIVLAILIIVVAVVALSFSSIVKKPPLPENLAGLGESLKTEVENSIIDSSRSALKAVSTNGGYLSAASLPVTVDYKGSKIAYWQFANASFALSKDQIGKEIARGIKDSLKNIDPQILGNKIGKKISLGNINDATVDVEIRDSEIVATVRTPLSIDDFSVTDTLEISVPTTLGKSINFASDVITKNLEENRNDRGEQYQNRFFEWFTITSLYSYRLNGIDGQPKVPVTSGPLIGCGKSIYKTWFDVKPELEALLEGSLKNTFIVGTTPPNITSTSSFQSHTLPIHTDQKVTFHLGEQLSERSFQMYPNPLTVRTVAAPYTTLCVSPPITVNYWLLFPVVAEVGEGGDKFKFAFSVFVNNDAPGEYGDTTRFIDAWKQQVNTCEKAQCDATVYVEDGDGPLGLAHINYAGCYLGRTDRQGVLSGSVPCGISVLEISKGDHTLYSEVVGSSDLEYKSVHLLKTPTLKLNLVTVEFTNQSGSLKVSNVESNTKEVSIGFKAGTQETSMQSSDSIAITKDVSPGSNSVVSVVRSGAGEELGGFFNDYIIGERNTEVWVYIPILKGGLGIAPPPSLQLTPREESEYDRLLDEGDSQKITAFIIKTAQAKGIDQSEINSDTSPALEFAQKINDLSKAIIDCGTKLGESLPVSEKQIDFDKIESC